MKLLTPAASAVISATMVTAPLVAMAQERIAVGSVNGSTIYLDEIMAVAQTLPPEYREAGLANLYSQLVDEVANSRLAAEAGRADGLDTDENVASAMKRAADRVLAEAYITDKVSSQIGEEAIQSAYDTFVADSASREQVTASHILVETEDEARAIIGQLNDGADFAELAREKSTGPSGPNGGSLGAFGRGQMVPAFEAAAFSMPVGSYSADPVQTQFGWHVIRKDKESIRRQVSSRCASRSPPICSRCGFARVVERFAPALPSKSAIATRWLPRRSPRRQTTMTVSPLAPESFPPPPMIAGVTLMTAASEMKYRGRDDMPLMRFADSMAVAGIFTRLDTAAAPVIRCRRQLHSSRAPRHSGQCRQCQCFYRQCRHGRGRDSGLATHIGCEAEDILMASTGVIGEPLDTDSLAVRHACRRRADGRTPRARS